MVHATNRASEARKSFVPEIVWSIISTMECPEYSTGNDKHGGDEWESRELRTSNLHKRARTSGRLRKSYGSRPAQGSSEPGSRLVSEVPECHEVLALEVTMAELEATKPGACSTVFATMAQADQCDSVARKQD